MTNSSKKTVDIRNIVERQNDKSEDFHIDEAVSISLQKSCNIQELN